jgi:hypothetical protein
MVLGDEKASRLVCKFSGHGRLACFQTNVPYPEANQKNNASKEARVFCVRDDSNLFGPQPLQQLLSNSHAVFSMLQNYKVGENKNTDYSLDLGYKILDADPSNLNLVHISKAYRCGLFNAIPPIET